MRIFITTNIERAASSTSGFFRTKYGIWFLATVSFLESAFPIPLVTDPFLVAYILAERLKWVRAVIVTTLASVLGGVAAYLMAAGFYEVLSRFALSPDMEAEFTTITTVIQEGVFWFTLAGAFTPVPYTIIGLAAGFTKANILMFIAASIIGRGLRYALVGWLTKQFGKQALAVARRRILLVSLLGVGLGLIYLYLH